MSEWNQGLLRDIATIIMGQSPKKEEVNSHGIGLPLLNGPTEFGPNYPTPVQFSDNCRKVAPQNSLLFCVRGSTTGRMNWADQKYGIGRGLASIVHKSGNAYNSFLKGVVDKSLSSLLASATGSTFPNVSRDQLNDLKISIPPLPEQKAIAHILGKLDDKIELNRQINQTLEAMAQALFKSWFVDFDPVLDNTLEAGSEIPDSLQAMAEKRQLVPNSKKLLHTNPALAAQFPSAFVFNEVLDKWVPEGWSDTIFGDEYNITMGQSPPGSSYNEEGTGKPFSQGKTDFGFRFPSNRIYCTDPKREANKNDTLISVRAPVGNANLASSDCIIGRGLSAVRHLSGSISFTYYSVLQLREIFDVFEGEGTVFGSINQTSLKGIRLVNPSNDLINGFDSLASSLDKKIGSTTNLME